MSRVTSNFKAFGVEYQTQQFAAVPALSFMDVWRDIHPCELLSQTSVIVDGKPVNLRDPAVINEYVLDKAGIIAPRLALAGLISLINENNFGFLTGWKGVKVPTRFLDGSATAKSNNVDPLISQILQEGSATLRDLEEYYSLEDAFKMFDVIMVKGVNAALSSEAAAKAAKTK